MLNCPDAKPSGRVV